MCFNARRALFLETFGYIQKYIHTVSFYNIDVYTIDIFPANSIYFVSDFLKKLFVDVLTVFQSFPHFVPVYKS